MHYANNTDFHDFAEWIQYLHFSNFEALISKIVSALLKSLSHKYDAFRGIFAYENHL